MVDIYLAWDKIANFVLLYNYYNLDCLNVSSHLILNIGKSEILFLYQKERNWDLENLFNIFLNKEIKIGFSDSKVYTDQNPSRKDRSWFQSSLFSNYAFLLCQNRECWVND